jgi:hypothetical protein
MLRAEAPTNSGDDAVAGGGHTEKGLKENQVKEGAASTASTYEQRARQEIRRARRLAVNGTPTPEATFNLSIAGVLALLDVAGAIRENRRGKTND